MNTISTPPIRAPFTDDRGIISGAWQQWISNLERLFNDLQGSGTTAQRPNPAPFVGYMYFDTTIGRPIWAETTSPTTWVDADGTAA